MFSFSQLLCFFQDEKDQRIRELTLELYNERQRCKRRCAAYQEQLQMVLKFVDEHSDHLSRSVQDMVQRIRELEDEDLDGSDQRQFSMVYYYFCTSFCSSNVSFKYTENQPIGSVYASFGLIYSDENLRG